MVSVAARRPGAAPDARAAVLARVELLGLLAATLATVAAVALAVAAKAERAGDIESGIAAGRVIALNEAPTRDALARTLRQVWPAGEAAAAAGELHAWLAGHRVPNVGALAQVAVPADRVRADPRLASARARLDAASREGGTVPSVPLFTGAELAALKPFVVVRRPGAFRQAAALSLLAVLAAFYALHALRRVTSSTADPLMLPAVHLLCGLGLTAMIGLRDPVRDLLLAPPFASGVALGSVVAALAWRASVERFAFQYTPLAAAILLSLLLIVFGDGPAGSAARVNLWGAQPVEAIRLFLVVYMAAFFARQWRHLRSIRDARSRTVAWLRGIAVPPLEYVVPVAAALGLVALFFVVQRDLGPALVFGCVFLALWAIAVRRAGLALFGLGTLAAGFWAVARIGWPSTLATRVAMAADPWANARPGGDQVAHAFWALGTGGIAGTGPGMGDPQYIPAGHTDLVLAAIGEELGFAGLAAAALAYLVIGHRALRIARRAPGDFSCFLALGLTFALLMQLLLIAGGSVGLVPLTGVVTPFLSYGRSAMVANFCAIGLLLAVSGSSAPAPREPLVRNFGRPVAWVSMCLAGIALLVAARVFHAQVWAADRTMTAPALVRLADGTLRFDSNPRLLAAARQLLDRGDITDRNGVVVATSDPARLRGSAAALTRLGIDPARACPPGAARCYPFGGLLYHATGDANTELDWHASNTSFVERDYADRLQGYDDRERAVAVRVAGSAPVTITRRDYTDLAPLVRLRYRPSHPDVQALRDRPRDVRLAIDVRLQRRVAEILRRGIASAGSTRGAAAVMDVATGDVLAAVSHPWPDLPADSPPDREARLDRVRYGAYPPGSTFKLVTAAATLALHPELAGARHVCQLLPDGRAGARLPGWSRPIRDDALTRRAHGRLGLDEALRVSCNAYFAQLAMELGPDALLAMAAEFGIDVAQPNTAASLRELLPYAAFGQGETLATPMRLLGVTAAIAAGGTLVEPRWVLEPAPEPRPEVRVLPVQAAQRLARDMAAAVESGTGRTLAGVRPAVAGKTGTAEVAGAPSHAWFTGFAPAAGGGRRLALVVLVEHGGYGGRAAAPIAGEIVRAARQLGLFQGDEE